MSIIREVDQSVERFPTKPGRTKMTASLQTLAGIEFDVLLANTRANNSIYFVELDGEACRTFLGAIPAQL